MHERQRVKGDERSMAFQILTAIRFDGSLRDQQVAQVRDKGAIVEGELPHHAELKNPYRFLFFEVDRPPCLDLVDCLAEKYPGSLWVDAQPFPDPLCGHDSEVRSARSAYILNRGFDALHLLHPEARAGRRGADGRRDVGDLQPASHLILSLPDRHYYTACDRVRPEVNTLRDRLTSALYGQQHVGPALLTFDEIRTLCPDRQLLFLAWQPPIIAAKLRYYADREFAGRFDPA